MYVLYTAWSPALGSEAAKPYEMNGRWSAHTTGALINSLHWLRVRQHKITLKSFRSAQRQWVSCADVHRTARSCCRSVRPAGRLIFGPPCTYGIMYQLMTVCWWIIKLLLLCWNLI